MRRVRLVQKDIRWRCQSSGLKSFRKWAKCSATLDSPCIHRFFLNLSDSLSFALLSSDVVSLCFHFPSLARSRLDRSRSISALARSFSHVNRLLVRLIPCGPGLLHFDSRTITSRSPRGQNSTTWLVVWGRDQRNRPHAIKVWRIYIYIYIYIYTVHIYT